MTRLFTGWALASAAVLALVGWWLATSSDSASAPANAPAPNVAAVKRIPSESESSSADAVQTAPLQTIFLPDKLIAAMPNTVRVGLAYVAPEDAQAFEDSRNAEGAGPETLAELANVTRWMPLPAQKRADGTVQVGPINLPRADRYDLRARGESPLHFYIATFTAENYPALVNPTVAAGIKITREPAPGSDVRVLLRRNGESTDEAAWQALMTAQDARLIEAFGEQALALAPEQTLLPLPPGALDVVLHIDGIEAERRSVDLVAGTLTDLRFDPVKQAVARSVAATLQLRFVEQGSNAPIAGLTVSWAEHDTVPPSISDIGGGVSFRGVDSQQAQRFRLQFPSDDSAFPRWPVQKALELRFGEEPPATETPRVIRKTIALRPLQWLLVKTGTLQVPTQHAAGRPYPIFLLQQGRAGRWLDVASDRFIPIPGGIAVALEEPGQFRVAALQSPWAVSYSTTANATLASPGSQYNAQLIVDAGRAIELTLMHRGVALANTEFAITAPVRGLPASTMTTDSNGRLQLDGVTVPSISLEVPGYAAAEVDLRSAIVTVELVESKFGER